MATTTKLFGKKMARRLFKLPSSVTCRNSYNIPEQYVYLSVLGEGSYGKVLKCRDKTTKRSVAIKIPTYSSNKKEVSMMRMFKENSLEKYNIVEFFDSFKMGSGQGLVFEVLDISLMDYFLKTRCDPMLLSDIRTIIQQMATAFDALKRLGVIHADVKPDNIVLVDHQTRPFRVKLIDFGLAISTTEAEIGKTLQVVSFRSPEIILGLPFSKAIDMWSLGSVMAEMVSGILPFQALHPFDALQLIVRLLGQPADHLLDSGKFTSNYFIRTESNGWRLEDPKEYWQVSLDYFNRSSRLQPLDDLKKMRFERRNKAEAEEREQCIELLRAMLEIDGNKRITPCEVLAHPFIDTTNQGHYSSYLQTGMNKKPELLILESLSEHLDCEPPATAPEDEDITFSIQPDRCSPSTTIASSVVIKVRPATAENTQVLDKELESNISLQVQMSETSGRFRNLEIEDFKSEDFECEPPASALKDDITNIRADHCSPSLTNKSSLVTEVQPATAENALQMKDQEDAVRKSGSFVEVTERDKLASRSEDANTCRNSGMEQRKKRKKKKKIFWRVCSWVRMFMGCIG